jgi:hypothetical protein
LKYDAHVDTWADGLFDEPGKAYIEVLEEMLNNYEYGIFPLKKPSPPLSLWAY